jgi:hypothetical protein
MLNYVSGAVIPKAGKILLSVKPLLGSDCPSYNTIQKFFRIEKYKHLDMKTYYRLTNNEISLFRADIILAEKRKMLKENK